MKITIVHNGVMSMAISPETELEKLQIAELFKGPVDSRIAATEQILGKNIADSVIISPKAKE